MSLGPARDATDLKSGSTVKTAGEEGFASVAACFVMFRAREDLQLVSMRLEAVIAVR